MSAPSKQLSPNAPEFVPRGYTTNNVIHGSANGLPLAVHPNMQAVAITNNHPNPHHLHSHPTHLHGQHGRELPQQMNSLRLNSSVGIGSNGQVPPSVSVQDRLQIFRQPAPTSVNANSNHMGAQQQQNNHYHQQQQQQTFHHHQHHHHPQQHQAPQHQRNYNDFNGGAMQQGGMQHQHQATHQQQFGGRYNKGGDRHNFSSDNRRYGGGAGGTIANGGGAGHHHSHQHQNHHNHGPPHHRQHQQNQHQQSSHHAPHHSHQHQNQNSTSGGMSVPHSLSTPSSNSSSPAVPPPSQQSSSSSSSQHDPQQQTEEETFAVNYVESLINCLNENPGSFDSITASALSVFEGFGNNEYILSNAMEMIFNRSIEEQNFRYMGAKLYGLLDLIDLRDNSSFRMLLTLKLEYHRNELLKYMQNEQSKVRGTTLFLAELYMQLRNDGNRIKDIAQNIVFSINQLLCKTTPENLKCICMTLKLAGYDLEFDCQQDMTAIIQKLSSVEALDVSTSRILENVLNLQKNQWGRKAEPAISLSQTSNTPLRISDEPVFYGPDGQILTEEESSFLIANLSMGGGVGGGGGGGFTGNNALNAPFIDDDSDSDLDVDPEMDEETKKAYKCFLKQQQQLQQQQQNQQILQQQHHHQHNM